MYWTTLSTYRISLELLKVVEKVLWNMTIGSRWKGTKKITMFWTIYLWREHFEGSKRGQMPKMPIKTLFSQHDPSWRWGGVDDSGDLAVLHQNCVTIEFTEFQIFWKWAVLKAISKQNCILPLCRNCGCTNVLILLWDVQKLFRIMIQSFFEHFQKVWKTVLS